MGASLIFLAFLGLLWLFPQLRGTSGKLGRLFGHWQILTLYAAAPAVIALFRNFFKISESVGSFIDAPRSAAAQGTLAEVREQLGRIMRQAQRRGHRIRKHAKRRVVIFVDDLERCPADKALDMCEVISQLLGHEDVLTVLSQTSTSWRLRRRPGISRRGQIRREQMIPQISGKTTCTSSFSFDSIFRHWIGKLSPPPLRWLALSTVRRKLANHEI